MIGVGSNGGEMMVVRAVVACALILVLAAPERTFSATPQPIDQPTRGVSPSAPLSGNEVGGLSFSESVDDGARPIDPAVDFSGSTLRLWISFNYYDYDYRTRPPVRYLIRANGDDWRRGDLTCCEGAQGRYAFPVERERDRPFGGAGYEVLIYVGGAEASRGSFVVRGTGGFDNDNNANDNHGFGPRGNLSNSH